MVYPGVAAAGAAAAGGLLAIVCFLKGSVRKEDIFWTDILWFRKKCIEKISKVRKADICGTKIFLKRAREGVQIIFKSYSLLDGKWNETAVTRTVPDSGIPPAIFEKLSYSEELDVTGMLDERMKAGKRKEKY